MKITSTDFAGLFIFEPKAYHDERGFFMEAFNVETLRKNGIDVDFVQDNQSFSKKNVVRGLHFQAKPYAQTKLVRVLSGKILDVVADLRKDEPTFGKSFKIELSAENRKQLFIPKGFAHGFLVLSDEAEIIYKTDEYYHPESEGGVLYDDPELKIDWGVERASAIISAKDLLLPLMKDVHVKF